MKSFNKFFLLAILVLSTILFSGCASLGGAGAPSEEQINAESEKAYQEFKSKSKISTNAKWNAMVQRVTQRIAAASGENFKWEAVLVENNEPNAWCMPGGKIAVFTGIMPVVKTEAALAAVLGHEVAHATLRHGMKGYSRAIEQQYAGVIAGVAGAAIGQFVCKTDACRTAAALGGMAGSMLYTVYNMKFSREDETSADTQGLVYMSKAGYQPSESVSLWQRMNAAGGGGGPEFMSTHPSGDNRIKNLNSQMGQANQIYQQAPQKFGLGQSI